MTSPRHLWSGNWREQSEAARPETEPRADEPTAVHEPEPEPAPPEPRGGGSSRPLRLLAMIAVPAVLVGIGAYALGTRGNDGTKQAKTAATKELPVSTTPAPAPKEANAQAIYKSAGPAVASVRTSGGSGTGFLLSDNRTLVTNAHVVETATDVTVRFGPSGKDLPGRVLGTDRNSDLAVVRIGGEGPPKEAKPLTLADSDKLAVGQTVVAIGNPFGLDRTVTQGIVSALGREIPALNGFNIENAIQTDAAINPGNSGGPLLDTAGRVVGVNSQIETGGTSSGNVGIGFAVPSNTVRRIVPLLAAGKTVEHAWLGVETTGASNPSGGSGIAAQVQRVIPGGPAAGAGIRAGDVITAIDGKPISAFSDIAQAVDEKNPGEKLKVHIRRGSDEQDLDVTLGTRPAQVP